MTLINVPGNHKPIVIIAIVGLLTWKPPDLDVRMLRKMKSQLKSKLTERLPKINDGLYSRHFFMAQDYGFNTGKSCNDL